MAFLLASVCEGIALELPECDELRSIARTSDYRHQHSLLLLPTTRLVVAHCLDRTVEWAATQHSALPMAVKRYRVFCDPTESALVFPVVNHLQGTGAGFAVFPYTAIRNLCG